MLEHLDHIEGSLNLDSIAAEWTWKLILCKRTG